MQLPTIKKKSKGLFHFQVKTHSRCGKGTVSSVAAAAYRGGTTLYDKRYGKRRTFSRKKEVIVSGIMLPIGAPPSFSNREYLWNAVEEAENRIDARLTRELIFALPKQLSVDQNVILITDFLQNLFVDAGMAVDWNYHDLRSRPKGDPSAPIVHNPHVHVLLTTRHIDSAGFGGKNREWDKKDLVPIWRAGWATYCNHALEDAGIDIEIDYRSHKERGIDAVATIHEGRKTPSNAKHWERKRKLNELARATRPTSGGSGIGDIGGGDGSSGGAIGGPDFIGTTTNIATPTNLESPIHGGCLSQESAIRPVIPAKGRKPRKRKVRPATDGDGWKF